MELIFVLLMVAAVPVGAHGMVVAVSIVNLLIVAWFWYNLVRSVEITTDNALRFWIGNIEIDVPFDKYCLTAASRFGDTLFRCKLSSA
jgi:hypothetical protein